MRTPDILVINSYAGSLTIAASQLKLKIRGSYEDCGFGLSIQRLNFPKLDYFDKPPWPGQDLSKTLVIAHPPCAAFSQQAPYRGGTDSDHFEPHRRVMRYALGQDCAALAIESVPGILAGAAEVHRKMAKRYGYQLYKIQQNAVTFGVPQWRPRVWIVFTKTKRLALWHHPTLRTVGDILRPRGTVLAKNHEITANLRCLAKAGYTEKQVYEELLGGEHIGSLLQIGKKLLELKRVGPNFKEVRDAWHLGGQFGVKMPRVLNPEGYATTILHDSSFFTMGRELFLEEYLALMGFPEDYKFPPTMLKDFRLYLSKGVCPPVAKWILEQLIENVSGRPRGTALATDMAMILQPGEVADFTITKNEAKQRRLL